MAGGASVAEVQELLRIRDVQGGVVDTGDAWLRMLEVDGAHYALLAPPEQSQVDHGLMQFAAGCKHPVKVWATNRPLGARREVERMSDLAAAWEDAVPGLAVLAQGIGGLLETWEAHELPERHIYVSVWVDHGGPRDAALVELDRRMDYVRRALQAALPGGHIQEMGTADVLRALHGFWLKDRHVRVRAEDLGARGETVLIVGLRGEGTSAAAEDPVGVGRSN